MPGRGRPIRWVIVVLLAVVLVGAACGDDTGDPAAEDESAEGDGTAGDATDGEDGEDTGGAEGEQAAPGGDTVEVTMVDYAYVGLPGSVPAGTSFTVVNDSEAELHELVAVLIPDEETRSVEELLALPEEELGTVFGGEPMPTAVLLAAPGGEMIPAVGDGTLTEPGRYAVACFIPVGADPQAYLEGAQESETEPPEVEGGPPHFTQGMFGEVVVE